MAISFSSSTGDLRKVKSDLLAVPVFADLKLGDDAKVVDEAIGGTLKRFMESAGFKAKPGETLVAPAADGIAAGSVVLVGVGKHGKSSAEDLRRAGAALARRARKATEVTAALGDVVGDGLDAGDVTQALAEGMVLGGYQFLAHKGKGTNGDGASKLRRVKVLGAGAARQGLSQGASLAGAVTLARDLINGPPRAVTPSELARVARGLKGIRTTVWDKARCEQEGLGGLLGVAAGSNEPPRLIRMVYSPPRPRATIAVVGKGITFDSGGLSLKPTGFIETMKYDMAGGAAVIGLMSLLSELAPPVKVIGIVPTTENMPGGSATKLGDVLTIRNGKTVEVLNTDAEGRLILADGLSLAVEAEPDAILDIATLTGACHVALGDDYAGIMGTNEDLMRQIEAAAEATGELVWRLPLPDDYRRQLDSDVADLKNVSASRYGGASTAGIFLKEFTGDVPWVHLDIAGVGWRDAASGYLTKGGTGYGVRLLAEVVTSFRKPKKR